MILYFVKFIGSDDETPIYGPFSTYEKAKSWMLQQMEDARPYIVQKVINGTLNTRVSYWYDPKRFQYNWEIVTAVLDTGQEII